MPVGNPLYTDYEPIADDNQASPPIGAPEGNYQGKYVNDTFRHMMAVIRKLGNGVLQLDGTTKPTADIDFNTKRVVNLGAHTNSRLAATRNDQLQEEPFTWGGTTTGTGAAYTVALTPSFTGSVYRAGQRVRFIAHVTSTSTTPTLNIGTPGPATMKNRDGSALNVGSLQIGHRYEAEWDGSAWRVLDAGGYMEQALYDILHPVGDVVKRTNQTTPTVPAGVTATWTRISEDRYAKITSGAPGTGGSANSGSTALTIAQMPLHGHPYRHITNSESTFSSTPTGGIATGGAHATRAAFTGTPTGTAGQQIGGEGGGQAHTHTIDPLFRSFAYWERTA